MFRSIGFAELTVILLVFGVLSLVPAIFYLLTLQRAIERCSVESRAMSPETVWLLLIPLFNLVWQFIVVNNISKSLRNEFAKRNLAAVSNDFDRALGLAMCILTIVSAIPIVGFATGMAACVCWIIYWVKIAGYARMLLPPLVVATT
jgi:hypothetical protein